VPDGGRDPRTGVVLDHVAIGTATLADGWELFGGLLGGAWAYGGNSPGFWWGQLQFAPGAKVELLTPTGGPGSGFLERFLATRGPGFHHLNFLVPDIEVTLGKIGALGIEPVGVRVQNPVWKEAFLRPDDGYGTVIQIAQQAGQPSASPPPAGFPIRGLASSLSRIEQRVADIDGALRLFRDVLDGEVVSRQATPAGLVAELSWPNQARLRLVESAAGREESTRSDAGIAYLEFSRDEGTFAPADRAQIAVLSQRLGASVRLDI
jgi:catechol 2,3-dioxygenase-like lactoylglutathione lyase family enzyme